MANKHELMVRSASSFSRTIFKMLYYHHTAYEKRKDIAFRNTRIDSEVLTAGYNYWIKWYHAGKLTHKQKLMWKR